jgi:hypothetical protein
MRAYHAASWLPLTAWGHAGARAPDPGRAARLRHGAHAIVAERRPLLCPHRLRGVALPRSSGHTAPAFRNARAPLLSWWHARPPVRCARPGAGRDLARRTSRCTASAWPAPGPGRVSAPRSPSGSFPPPRRSPRRPCASMPGRCAPGRAVPPCPPGCPSRAPPNTGSGGRATRSLQASPSAITPRPPARRTSGSRSLAFFAAKLSPFSQRVMIRRRACQCAHSDSLSPSCGQCTPTRSASPLTTKSCSANDGAKAIRSSSDSAAFAGSASTISRATSASLRFSAASAAFHCTVRSANRAQAPSGASASWPSRAS